MYDQAMSKRDDMIISLTETDHKGRYEAIVPGIADAAELTYSRLNQHTIIADHTGVPDALRGRGVGMALVERLISDAREKDFKIVPLCPYVKAQYRRHPEWSDVMTE